jgi:hypothetical protein
MRPSRSMVNVHGRHMGLDDAGGAEVDQAGLNTRFLETNGYEEVHGDPGTPLDAGKRAVWNLHASLLGNGDTRCQGGYRHLNRYHGGPLAAASSYHTPAAFLDTLNFAVSHPEMGNGHHEIRHSQLHDGQHRWDVAMELVE